MPLAFCSVFEGLFAPLRAGNICLKLVCLLFPLRGAKSHRDTVASSPSRSTVPRGDVVRLTRRSRPSLPDRLDLRSLSLGFVASRTCARRPTAPGREHFSAARLPKTLAFEAGAVSEVGKRRPRDGTHGGESKLKLWPSTPGGGFLSARLSCGVAYQP